MEEEVERWPRSGTRASPRRTGEDPDRGSEKDSAESNEESHPAMAENEEGEERKNEATSEVEDDSTKEKVPEEAESAPPTGDVATGFPIRLTYFDGRGRAELIRLVLAAGRMDYEDRRLTGDAWHRIKEGSACRTGGGG